MESQVVVKKFHPITNDCHTIVSYFFLSNIPILKMERVQVQKRTKKLGKIRNGPTYPICGALTGEYKYNTQRGKKAILC